ncbi:DUF5995 family protein [Acidimicrobiia bacterium EGI L10123]|uniref:DUF5995 family protein n=1 Tax=Salinilacustrithrix flava TaxID=2957203 RepID=UPI003D7C1E96|nr:DUF5995 family protein [Acidimicrobiia bacterium EGI L10123]
MRTTKAMVAVLVTALLIGTAAPAGAGLLSGSDSEETSSYDDPFFLNWPTYLLATTPDTYVASESDECKKGHLNCVDRVIREMTKRFNALGCDHDSTFAFTYLLTTEEYRRAVEDPEFFTDNAFINHQDAVFADYYFEQLDDWDRGAIGEVSPAWRIAFDSAERQRVSGTGNVFLGMNAHVNRDLPFVLADIGLVKPDGTSRKPDHDRVNDFLAATNQYLLAEAAKFLDPTLDDGDIPGTSIDNSVMVQALVAWREQAWRNAERLVAAPTPEARDRVAEEIEQVAAAEALLIRTAFSYTPLHTLLGMGPSQRNAFCEANFRTR